LSMLQNNTEGGFKCGTTRLRGGYYNHKATRNSASDWKRRNDPNASEGGGKN